MVPRLSSALLFIALLSLGALIPWTGVTMSDLWGRGRQNADAETLDLSERECGPKSLWIALGRLGITVDYDMLLEQCPVGERGTSLGQLERFGRQVVQTRLAGITWEQLVAHRGTAVLFVGGDHFFCADSRGAETGHVQIYDPGRVATSWSRTELESVWRGETLLLTRTTPEPTSVTPRAHFGSVIEDCGFIYAAKQDAVFSFVCKNTGSQPLKLERGPTSCSCTNLQLSETSLAPGAEAKIDVTVTLAGKRGSFAERAVVKTNDPDCPIVMLRCLGGVYPNSITSLDVVYFGDVKQGDHISKEFFIHDPSTGNLRIESITSSLTSAEMKSQVSVERVGPGSSLIGRDGRFPVVEGDYLAKITLECPPHAQIGAQKGEIVIVTNLPAPMDRILVGLDARVRSDIEVRPGALLIVNDPSKAGSHTVRLSRAHGRSLEINEARVSEQLPLTVRAEALPGNEIQLIVSSIETQVAQASREGRIHCRFADGATVSVPVVLVSQRTTSSDSQ